MGSPGARVLLAPHSSPSSLLSRPAAGVPVLAAAALHGIVGEFVRALEPYTEAAAPSLLIQTLVALGAAMGRGAYFPHESSRHYGNLFAVIVGSTAKARKGTSWGHVRRLMDAVAPELRNANGLSSGEGLINAVRDAGHDAAGEVIPGVDDKRLLVIEGEFSSVLAMMDRTGNILSQVLRSGWDGEPLRVLTRAMPLQSTDHHISIVGHITVEELLRRLKATEKANGFANRFLWVYTERARLLAAPPSVPDSLFSDFGRRMRPALALGREPRPVRRSETATSLWIDVYAKLSEERGGMVGAITSRSEALVMRLALIYAILDGRGEIEPVHLEAALAMWRYCEGSCVYIWGNSFGYPLADTILSLLRQAGTAGRSRTEIQAAMSRHVRSDDITSALAFLADKGFAHMEPRATGGRPEERWFIEVASVPIEAQQPPPPIPPDTGGGRSPETHVGDMPDEPEAGIPFEIFFNAAVPDGTAVAPAVSPPTSEFATAVAPAATPDTARDEPPVVAQVPQEAVPDLLVNGVARVRDELLRSPSRTAQSVARATGQSLDVVKHALQGWAETTRIGDEVIYNPPMPRREVTP